MPTSTFRQVYQINRSAYRPEATAEERERARDAKLDLFRTLDLGVDAKTRQRIVDEGFTRGEDGKFHNGSYVIHPHCDSVFRRVVDGSSFFAEFEGLRRASTGGWRKWLPRDRDENVYLSLMNLGQHLENMGHIARRGWYFPDNPMTIAGYAVILGLLGAILNGVLSGTFVFGLGGFVAAALAGLVVGIPATLYFRTSDRNANPEYAMVRPWHQAQMLDYEVSFYRSGRLEEWLHADQLPLRLPPAGESRQTVEALLSNPLFKEFGQVLDPSYVDGSYRAKGTLPARTIVPARQF